MDDAHRAIVLVHHRQGIEAGLQAEALQYLGDQHVLADRDLLDPEAGDGGRFLGEIGTAGGDHRQQGLDLARRGRRRAAQQIALHQVDAHASQGRQLFVGLDALGDHLGPGGFGHLQDGADEFAFHRIAVDGFDEMPIDLDEVRAQLRPAPEAGIARAQIIEGDGEAHGAVVVQGGGQQREVIDGRLFGQLDHHLGR